MTRPSEPALPPHETVEQPPTGRTAQAGSAAAPLRLLVVDDDTVDRMALSRAIERTGMAVVIGEAHGVLAAIELLTSETYDCVLLDYNLPDGDGLTFLRGLRGAGISTSVIMITGQQDAELAAELLAAGARDYIPKALLTPERLAETLQRIRSEPRTQD